MTRLIRLLVVPAALLGGLSLTSACGQKGPLFLPDDADKTQDAATSAAQEPEKTKKETSGGY